MHAIYATHKCETHAYLSNIHVYAIYVHTCNIHNASVVTYIYVHIKCINAVMLIHLKAFKQPINEYK